MTDLINVVLFALFISSLTLFIGGGILFFKRGATFKEPVFNHFTSMVEEGLRAFSFRVISIIMQLILYAFALFFLLAYFFEFDIYWEQLFSLLFGVFMMMGVSFSMLLLVPKFMPYLFNAGKGYPFALISASYHISKGISFVIFSVVLLGLFLSYSLFGMASMVAYALGVLGVSFFLRIGGGLYKTSAKVSAELLSQKEPGMDSFYNPAKVLDVTGSYIAQMIGFSSDILSSFMIVFIAAVLSSKLAVLFFPSATALTAMPFRVFPFFIVALSLVVALISYVLGAIRIRFRYQNILLETIYLSLFLNVVFLFFSLDFLKVPNASSLFFVYCLGTIFAVLIALISDYYTRMNNSPSKSIAEQSEMGVVMPVFSGLGDSFLSNALFLTILLCLGLLSFHLYGVYGLSVFALGMLSATSSFISSRVFASLSDNLVTSATLLTSDLTLLKHSKESDDLGFTVSSLGNGFATAVALLSTLTVLIVLFQDKFVLLVKVNQEWLIGMVLGVIATLLFSASIFKGINFAIKAGIEEVYRQYKEIPYLIDGKCYPDIHKASNLHAIIALKVLLFPAIYLIFFPLLVFYFSGLNALFGFLMGVFLMGMSQGFSWANFGDSISNVYRYVAKGGYGGRESPSFDAIQTALQYATAYNEGLSPSFNILIKSVAILAIFLVAIVLL